jgi:thioester reductase-like protein
MSGITNVYCLVRAASPEAAHNRVVSTLKAKRVELVNPQKLICLPADLSQADLGIDSLVLSSLQERLTMVIHCAWAVNFNLGVQSFEKHHIRGAHNLMNFCLSTSTPKPAAFYFCSSESAAAGTPLPATIQETYIKDLSHAQGMGYARSKLVTENIIKAAEDHTEMRAKVLRVGQIVGDSVTGLWNTTEAIPLMLRSAKTLGALPELDEVSFRIQCREIY